MDTALTRLAGLGIAAVLLLALLWLFTLSQVTDTTASAAARGIDESLGRSLVAGGGSRVTMFREAAGVQAPRRYMVRLRPSEAVAADANAVARLAERAARIVAAQLDHVKGPVQIHCLSTFPDGREAHLCFQRQAGGGAVDLRLVMPPPPLPASASPSGRDGR